MHSKWQIWDYFSAQDRSFLSKFEGVLGVSTFDPVCQMLVKDHLMRGGEGRKIHHKLANEVTRDWIETEFLTLSLFSETDSFYIHQSQDLSSEIIDLLASLNLSSRFVLLSFDKENKEWKRILKGSEISTITIEAPRFWELNKLLDFVAVYLGLPLSYEAKSWMIDSIENDLGTFYNACSLLKLNYPTAREVSLTQVRELLTLEKLDQFAMASLFARKKRSDFYAKLVSLEGDFEKMRVLFNFLQSHLVKMMDPSYLSQKPRLTQYDKDIQSTSKLWKTSDLVQEIDKFNHWEIMSKKKDPLLWHDLRMIYLSTLKMP